MSDATNLVVQFEDLLNGGAELLGHVGGMGATSLPSSYGASQRLLYLAEPGPDIVGDSVIAGFDTPVVEHGLSVCVVGLKEEVPHLVVNVPALVSSPAKERQEPAKGVWLREPELDKAQP